MSGEYAEILDRSWDEIPAVQNLPVGTWRLRGRNMTFRAGEGDNSDQYIMVYVPKEPLDDVDEAALEELGADYDVENNRIFYRVWVETSADLDKLRDHLAKHGIETKGKTIRQTMEAFKGTEVFAYLDLRTYTNKSGEVVSTNDPSSFAPVED